MDLVSASTSSKLRPRWPVVAGRWTYLRTGVQCELPLKRLRVHAPPEFLREVERHCDGKTAWTDVHSGLSQRWPDGDVERSLQALIDQGVLIEASHALASQARIGWAPQPLGAPAGSLEAVRALRQKTDDELNTAADSGNLLRPARTKLQEALRQRRSTQTFDDRALSLQALVNILWSLYGVLEEHRGRTRRTVPSGGALYGLRWFIALIRPTGHYAPGLYEIKYHATEEFGGALTLSSLPGAIDSAWATLLAPHSLRYAHAAIFPIADLPFISEKYGNRALTLAMIEAGHALQNAALAALEEQASSIVRGDTVETEVQALFGLPEGLYPLPALLIGATPTPEQEALALQTNDQVPVHPVPQHTLALPLAARIAVAGPLVIPGAEGQTLWAAGRSRNPRTATIKAQAEAWERMGWCSAPHNLEHARIGDIGDDALDPRELVAYSAAQHRRSGFPFQPFSSARTYPWVQATDASDGKSRWVMAQCVYAASALNNGKSQTPFTRSNTSGLAAFTDRETAQTRALMELVERDAFCRQWLSGSAPARINESTIAAPTRERLLQLRAAGYAISLHWLPSDVLPVVACFAQSRAGSMTALTTGAGLELYEALDACIGEAESRIQQHHGKATGAALRANQVISANQHGEYFATKSSFDKADWWLRNTALATTKEIAACARAQTSAELLALLLEKGHHVIFCDLTPPEAAIDQGRQPLHVARAFATGLIPLWFGHGLEPLGLQCVASLRTSSKFSASHGIHPCT